jgi:hypothetical protein
MIEVIAFPLWVKSGFDEDERDRPLSANGGHLFRGDLVGLLGANPTFGRSASSST